MATLESDGNFLTSSPKMAQQARAQKAVIEYPLPGTRQTHEIVAIGNRFLIISQQDCSGLLKVELDTTSGRPIGVQRFPMGSSKYAGLHGLFASKKRPGFLWATLQFESKLLFIDPRADALATAPEVKQSIQLPGSVWGPHVVIEDEEGNIWTTCKGSGHLVKVMNFNFGNPGVRSYACVEYACAGRPIFVAVHPESKEVYASLDLQSKILRMDRKAAMSKEPTEEGITYIDIPEEEGKTPVGLVAGPDGNVWFVLLGDSAGGKGTFACIPKSGVPMWFKLPLGSNNGLIHLAFDNPPHLHTGESTQPVKGNPSVLRVWLLGSSMITPNSPDGVFCVSIANNRIVKQDTVFLPTQPCFNHRILPHRNGFFVVELKVSILAYLAGSAIGRGDGRLTLQEVNEAPNETSDSFSLWGLGMYSDSLTYIPEAAWSVTKH